MGIIRIGNSGWSYKDWVGSFYPKGTVSGKMLNIYFQHFDTVEINSTFYRQPSRDTVKGWAETASKREGCEFCVKVPRSISHVSAMEEDGERMAEEYRSFSENVLVPLDEMGVLGAVLFQASPYFTVRGDIKYKMKSEPKVPLPDYSLGLDRLKEICLMMANHPGDRAFEFRNSSWLDEKSGFIKDAREVLRNTAMALVTVDGPSFPWIQADTSRHNYIRFHGRNREGWYKDIENDPSARYRYHYTEDELGEKVDPIKVMASKVDRETRIFFNNHPQGFAPQNAGVLMEMLGVERPLGAIDRFW